MTQDIRQWLAEIKSLQHKLAEVQQERDQAYTSAANWRQLYETEAKQRRLEFEAAQSKIANLEAKLEANQRPSPDASDYDQVVQQQIEQWQTPEDLKTQLIQALLECDRLTQALAAEQQSHSQTRQDLTMALGDTMEQLTKARRQSSTATRLAAQPTPSPAKPPAKPIGDARSPSPEPRSPDPVRSPS